MIELGDKIVEEARTWIGTRFRHQGFQKGVGCDCSGLIRGVLEAVIGFQYEDAWDYTHRPHARALLAMLNKYFVRIPVGEAQPGDILLFKVDNNPQHLAIKTDRGMIHAYVWGPRCVEEVSFAPPWIERLVGVWRVPEARPALRQKNAEEGSSGPQGVPFHTDLKRGLKHVR